MSKKILSIAIATVIMSALFFSNVERIVYANSNILGTYTTVFGQWDKNRTNNIMLSASKIDGTILKSGQVFSFNDVVGQRTEDKGYLESTIFVYDEKVKGIGGGVCQVSTTLYNTALYANMDIVERHTHKREVYYVPEGRDATVSYGTLDFKFMNNKPYDVMIRAYTVGDKLTVEIVQI